MPQPYNYKVNTSSPFDEMYKGYKFQSEVEALDLEQQQQQAALAQQQQMNVDLQSVAANPTVDSIAKLSIKYPQFADKLKNSFGMLDQSQKDTKISTAVPIYAAIQNGEYGTAINKLEEQAQGYENSGDAKQAESTRAIAKMVESHPEQAKLTLGMYMSGLMGSDKFQQTFSGLQKTQDEINKSPVELDKLQAETEIKNIEAENLPQEKALAMEKQTQDIETSKLERKLKVLDAEIKKTDSQTKIDQLELEREKVLSTLNDKKTLATEKATKSLASITTSKELIKRALSHPGLKGATGFDGPFNRLFSGTDIKDFEGLIETIKSRQFLDNIPLMTGMGALSVAEGDKLQSSVASLNLNQKATTIIENLEYIDKKLTEAERTLVGSGKLPNEGGSFIMNHPKLGKIDEGKINKMMKANPNATRQNIIDYLNQTSGE